MAIHSTGFQVPSAGAPPLYTLTAAAPSRARWLVGLPMATSSVLLLLDKTLRSYTIRGVVYRV